MLGIVVVDVERQVSGLLLALVGHDVLHRVDGVAAQVDAGDSLRFLLGLDRHFAFQAVIDQRIVGTGIAKADALGVRARRTGRVDQLERIGWEHQNLAGAAGHVDAREQDVCDLGIGRAIATRDGGQDRIDDCRFAGGHLGHKFLLKIWVAMAQATS